MRSIVGLAILVVTVAGCKPAAKPCPSVSASMSAVLGEAAVVRLDVYGSAARCNGDTIAAGAPPPSQSETVNTGKQLTLDVPAGPHTLLLSAFKDAAATQLLGSACTETNVKADTPGCFDLKLIAIPVHDMATTSPTFDFASATGDLAETPACSASPDNCPSGQYCASNGSCAPGCKVDLDCAGTPATPRCLVAAHQCVACLGNSDCAPGKLCSPSNTCVDGCDTQAPDCPASQMCCSSFCTDTSSDADNCGACGKACSLTQATATCTSSQCAIKQCNPGYSDCNGTASDGCECANLGDANKGCCPSGGCEASHVDGYGQSFIDCYSLGTYNVNVATDAANAYDSKGDITSGGCATPGNQLAVCNMRATECICFTYADSAGGVYVGRARRTPKSGSTVSCVCANNDSGDVLWK